MQDPTPTSQDPSDDWTARRDALRAEHPGQKDSVLFCLHKLQQDRAVGLRDLRDEAAVRGIPMAGRALHSAKVLLGMAQAKPRRPNRAKPASPQPATDSPSAPASDQAVEDQVLAAVRQIQSAAGAEADRMREAMRRAVEILQRAIES